MNKFKIRKLDIKNFKAFKEETPFVLDGDNLIFIGPNDSGKSTVLEAMDIFFNQEKIDAKLVPEPKEDVEIGILFGDNTYVRKVYTGKTNALKKNKSKGLENQPSVNFIFIPERNKPVEDVITELANDNATTGVDDKTIEYLEEVGQESINDVINSIDEEFLVTEKTKDTELEGTLELNIAKGFKFKVESRGVPIQGRGSGFQKNVLYSLLTNKEYKSTILAR